MALDEDRGQVRICDPQWANRAEKRSGYRFPGKIVAIGCPKKKKVPVETAISQGTNKNNH